MLISRRSSSLDLLRVLAIAMMIAYHVAYDLEFFYGFNLNVGVGPWHMLERICATLFLLVSGISFAYSWDRNPDWKRTAKRGLKVLGYGLVVSVATYLFDPSTYVRFGILHLIGVGTLLLPLFIAKQRRAEIALSFGCAILLLTFNLKQGTADTGWLIPLGFTPYGYMSVDYFPLFPWFSAMLYGLGLGFLTCRNQAFFLVLPERTQKAHPKLSAGIEWISRRSLSIYMIHQPFILSFLYLVFGR